MRDADGCAVNSKPLYWPGASVDVWVDPNGSPKRGISADVAREILTAALRTWTSVECPDNGPSIEVGRVELLNAQSAVALGLTLFDADAGAVVGGEPTPADKYASVFRFIDDVWPHMAGHAIALTTISFGVESGRIVGADIEVNSANFNITTSSTAADFDLASLVTHEAGHFWGLDDLENPEFSERTMYGYYHGGGDLGPRTLDADDERGMCAIYPSGRFDEEPDCGCAWAAREPGAAVLAGLAYLGLLLRRRQRKHG